MTGSSESGSALADIAEGYEIVRRARGWALVAPDGRAVNWHPSRKAARENRDRALAMMREIAEYRRAEQARLEQLGPRIGVDDIRPGDQIVLVADAGRHLRYLVEEVRHRSSVDGAPFCLAFWRDGDRLSPLLLTPGAHIRRARQGQLQNT